jgi:type IV fimbrial biogenesis protein FimT
MIITISVAAILTAIAVPSYKYVITDNRMASEVNDLVADMQYARAEAIKEGNDVVVCSSSGTAGTCSGTTTWQSGWMIFSDPAGNGNFQTGDIILRVHNGFNSGDTLAPADNLTTEVQFNRDGFAVGLANAGVLLQLHDSTDNANWTRCLGITVVGALSTLTHGASLPNGATCQ